MCGIAGIWNLGLSRDESVCSIARMTQHLEHRGPDGGDIYLAEDVALGHRRLSIISPDESANQPMFRNGLVIVYNGELYNYREEKARLQEKGTKFSTESDTEVILALYENEGLNFLDRLDGIFSFAIYDKLNKRLICARDPFGVKPFLYSRNKNGLIFSSEMKSILSSGYISKDLDLSAIQGLLLKGSISQPLTMLDDVSSLLPGHYLVCHNDQIVVRKYYDLHAGSRPKMKDDDWRDVIRESLKKSVIDQLVSDVPIGAFLSGGVDSGLIAAIMAQHATGVNTYSVGFENPQSSGEYDETKDAKVVSDFLGTDHTTFTISDSDVKNDLQRIVTSLDHPTIDGINSFYVSKACSNHVKVALSGTGADEVFGGYKWFVDMVEFYGRGPVDRLRNLRGYRSSKHYYNSLHRVFLKKEISNLLDKGRFSKKEKINLPKGGRNLVGVSKTSSMIMESFLQNQLLPDIDTASMSHGLEVRVPFLSKSLVEDALALPDHLKIGSPNENAELGSYDREGTKRILLDIAKEYLPAGFGTRAKRGFSLPMARWMNTVWHEELQDSVSSDAVKRRGIFNEGEILRLFNDSSAIPWTQKWIMVSVELWCQNFLDGDSLI